MARPEQQEGSTYYPNQIDDATPSQNIRRGPAAGAAARRRLPLAETREGLTLE